MGLGVDSIDTSGWIKKAAFGAIILGGTSDRHVSRVPKRTYVLDDLNAKEKWLNCDCAVCMDYEDHDLRLKEFAEKSNHGRFLRAAHNVCIQQREITIAKNAMKNNTFDEYIKSRKKNSFYRRHAEALFNIEIPKGEKSMY